MKGRFESETTDGTEGRGVKITRMDQMVKCGAGLSTKESGVEICRPIPDLRQIEKSADIEATIFYRTDPNIAVTGPMHLEVVDPWSTAEVCLEPDPLSGFCAFLQHPSAGTDCPGGIHRAGISGVGQQFTPEISQYPGEDSIESVTGDTECFFR